MRGAPMKDRIETRPGYRIGKVCAKPYHNHRYGLHVVNVEPIGPTHPGCAKFTATDGAMAVRVVGQSRGISSPMTIDGKAFEGASDARAWTEIRSDANGIGYSIRKEPRAVGGPVSFPPCDDVIVPAADTLDAKSVTVSVDKLRRILDAIEDQTLSASDRRDQTVSIQISEPHKPLRFISKTRDGESVAVAILMPCKPSDRIESDDFNAEFKRGAR
jgi:hypothetical protein